MTIKQQGGVFGRNPTFNDVDANSVTADQATVNGVLLADEVGINTPPSYPLHVVRDTNGFIAGFRNSDATTLARTIAAGNSLGDLVTAVLANTGNGVIYSDSGKTLALSANGSTTAALTVETSLNVSLRENLVMANGKGIDFSATSGTGTSELFDDYEEGTWTPVYTASTTDPTFASYPVRSAHYRKIGAMVFVTARFRTNGYNSDGVGNLRISGLPYTAKSSGSFFDTGGITIHSVQNWGSIPYNGVVKPGDAFISLIGSTGFVDQSVLALGTGTNNNDISFSGMYVTD